MNKLNGFSALSNGELSKVEGGSGTTTIVTTGLKILWSAYKHRSTIQKNFNKGFRN